MIPSILCTTLSCALCAAQSPAVPGVAARSPAVPSQDAAQLPAVSSEDAAHPATAPTADAQGQWQGPVLPPHLAKLPGDYWVVGVALESFGTGFEGSDALFGLAAMYRWKALGPHALITSKPNPEGIEQSRFAAGLGLRGYVPVWRTELSYGVGLHAEMRLEDHFWLGYVTPLELGATLYAERSWDVQVFLGVRRAVAGALINHFLIDPNGIDNEQAEDELDRHRVREPWLGFARIVIGRRLD